MRFWLWPGPSRPTRLLRIGDSVSPCEEYDRKLLWLASLLSLLMCWPAPEYRAKDKLENKLPKLVCAGKMSLSDAQACVESDWVRCAAKVKELEGKL